MKNCVEKHKLSFLTDGAAGIDERWTIGIGSVETAVKGRKVGLKLNTAYVMELMSVTVLWKRETPTETQAEMMVSGTIGPKMITVTGLLFSD